MCVLRIPLDLLRFSLTLASTFPVRLFEQNTPGATSLEHQTLGGSPHPQHFGRGPADVPPNNDIPFSGL